MARVRVVTSFSPEGYGVYGREFLKTFHEHWGVPLTVVVEPGQERTALIEKSTLVLELDASPLEAQTQDPRYRAASLKNRTAFLKWGRKALALALAAEACRVRWLIWVDADVRVTAKVTTGWMIGKAVLNPEADVSALLRSGNYTGAPQYPETGFVAYTLRLARVRAFIAELRDLFLSGDVFDLEEWNDAYAFGWLLDRHPEMVVHNITRSTGSHPWRTSALQQVMRHFKGPRRKWMHYGIWDAMHPSKIESGIVMPPRPARTES